MGQVGSSTDGSFSFLLLEMVNVLATCWIVFGVIAVVAAMGCVTLAAYIEKTKDSSNVLPPTKIITFLTYAAIISGIVFAMCTGIWWENRKGNGGYGGYGGYSSYTDQSVAS